MKHQTVEEVVEQASLYALGALGEEEARLFEAHLTEGCEVCAGEVRSFDHVVASLAECSPESAPAPQVRARLSEFLAEENPAAEKSPMLKIRAGEGAWHEIARGVFLKKLFEDARRRTMTTLIRLQPGARIPSHRHAGIEECVVLEGEVLTEGETFGVGDYLCAPAGSLHEQVSSTHGALLFIVAAAGEAAAV